MKNRVLVRLPANTVDLGLRIEERGKVDVPLAKVQHMRYCAALVDLGYDLQIALLPDDRYPDSVFVEDPALIVESTLIVTRLTRKERRGEEVAMENVLNWFYPDVARITDGYVEGGDVLVTKDRLYIGLSNRTDVAGAEQLAGIAFDRHGVRSSFIQIPPDHLHLKGEVSYHPDRGIITVSERLAGDFAKVNPKEKLVVIPAHDPKQRFGANCISKGNQILVHGGCSKAKEILKADGWDVREVWLTEYDKIDGAMSCLSKFF